MALRAGYKGIKKTGNGINLSTDGILSLSGSGAEKLTELTDVNITEPANGNILTYDSTDEEWKNVAPTSIGLDDLNDVDITNPSDGQIVQYDATSQKWINGSGKADTTLIAPVQSTLTASKAYAVGEQFVYNQTLYKVTQAIASGTAITIGTNAVVAGSVTEQLIAKSELSRWTLNTTGISWDNNRTYAYRVGNIVYWGLRATINSVTPVTGTNDLKLIDFPSDYPYFDAVRFTTVLGSGDWSQPGVLANSNCYGRTMIIPSATSLNLAGKTIMGTGILIL